jgi:hypothetical protein
MFQDLPQELQEQFIKDQEYFKRLNKRLNRSALIEPYCFLPISQKEFERNLRSGFIFVTTEGGITNDFHIFEYKNNKYNYLNTLTTVEGPDPGTFVIDFIDQKINYEDLEIIDVWYSLDIIKQLYKLRKQCKDENMFAGQQLQNILKLNYDVDISLFMTKFKQILYLIYNFDELEDYYDDFMNSVEVVKEVLFNYEGNAEDEFKFNAFMNNVSNLYDKLLEELNIS